MTSQQELEDSIDRFGQTALRVKAERDELRHALKEILAHANADDDFSDVAIPEIKKIATAALAKTV